jgi:hypothetical protein
MKDKRIKKSKKSLLIHFDELKARFGNHNLTYREIHLNTNIPEEMLQIYFSDENQVIKDLSTLFEFGKTTLSSLPRVFTTYKIFDNGKMLKIARLIEPKASMYYDKATQRYYRFEFKRKRFKGSEEINKDLVINEMDKHIKIHLRKHK